MVSVSSSQPNATQCSEFESQKIEKKIYSFSLADFYLIIIFSSFIALPSIFLLKKLKLLLFDHSNGIAFSLVRGKPGHQLSKRRNSILLRGKIIYYRPVSANRFIKTCSTPCKVGEKARTFIFWGYYVSRKAARTTLNLNGWFLVFVFREDFYHEIFSNSLNNTLTPWFYKWFMLTIL